MKAMLDVGGRTTDLNDRTSPQKILREIKLDCEPKLAPGTSKNMFIKFPAGVPLYVIDRCMNDSICVWICNLRGLKKKEGRKKKKRIL